ncbi:hypothetical protein P4B35_14100 [Pontiellaceae bacterium B12227]|nr:hypothetical protein [Pontiellaceae bacterium B12227]
MQNRILSSSKVLTVTTVVLMLLTSSYSTTQQETSASFREKLLKGTWTWDLDSNSDGASDSADLWWEHVDAHERYLVPKNDAQLAILKGKVFSNLSLRDLRTADFESTRISASDANPVLDTGTVLAVRTSDGNYAKIEVIGFEPLKSSRHDTQKYHMRLRYVLYQK